MLDLGTNTAQEAKEETRSTEEKVKCPISGVDMDVTVCPIKTCMWSCATGSGCSYKETAVPLVFAANKGLETKDAKEQIRKYELRIQKGLILDKYIEFVRGNGSVNLAHNTRKSLIDICRKTKSLAWNKVFNLDVATFMALCSKKNFKLFRETHGIEMTLSSLLGIRVMQLEAIRNSLNKRKAQLATKEKQSVSTPKRKTP